MKMRAAISLLVWVLACAVAGAQDVVTNSEFEADTAGWAPISPQTTLTWSGAQDFAGDPTSGSAVVTHVSDLATTTGPVQCVPRIEDGVEYDLSGWIRIPWGQAVYGFAYLLVVWWTEPDCQGTQTNGLLSPLVARFDTWVEASARPETPPARTESATLYLAVHKDVATADHLVVYFDHIAFGTPSMVFFDGFERGDTAEWSSGPP